MKEVRLKFEILGVISKGLYENETFLKTSVNHLSSVKNSILLKGLKRLDVKSSKIACLSKMFVLQIYTGDDWSLTSSAWSFGLKKLSEFRCRNGWYVYRSRRNCLCFFTNYEYKHQRYRALTDRLDIDHWSSEVGSQFVYFHT